MSLFGVVETDVQGRSGAGFWFLKNLTGIALMIWPGAIGAVMLESSGIPVEINFSVWHWRINRNRPCATDFTDPLPIF